jgi:hypothetical protein
MRMRLQHIVAASRELSFFIGSPGWPTKAEAAGTQTQFGIESLAAAFPQ